MRLWAQGVPTGGESPQPNPGDQFPQAPEPAQAPQPMAPPQPTYVEAPPIKVTPPPMGDGGGVMRYALIAVPAVVVIALLAYFFVLPNLHTSNTVVTAPATTTVQSIGQLSSCATITSPGSYYLGRDIGYSEQSGACINVTVDDVALVCDGKSITGSGPYTNTGPFSYGVLAQGRYNVSVNGCTISNFSYGVFSSSTSSLQLLNSNLTTNYISDIYMSNTTGSTVSDNYVGAANSTVGAVVVTNGSRDDLFSNNTLKLNAIYGFNISSSGENFVNNYVANSKFAFVCSPYSGFESNSTASGNTCYNDSGCDFLTCRGVNIPHNISKITLGPTINTCGTIMYPGIYSLGTSLVASSYINYTRYGSYPYGCINIDAPNVTLRCGGRSITGANIGILAVGVAGVSVSGCNLSRDNVGILLKNLFGPSLTDTDLFYDNISVETYNVISPTMSAVNASRGGYGMLFQSTAGGIISNFSTDWNNYGIYMNSSDGETFTGGASRNNTRYDVYTGVDSTQNFMTGTACSLSDATWSSCKYITNSSKVGLSFPFSSCISITRSGTYDMQQNIVDAPAGCITVQSNNVDVVCNGFTLGARPSTLGAGIIVNHRSNVTVNGCKMTNYATGIFVGNSTDINVVGLNGTFLSAIGAELVNDTGGTISGSTFSDTTNASIYVDDVRGMAIQNNTMLQEKAGNIGLLVINSTEDRILGNSGNSNYVGLYLKGRSGNNTVSNNNFETSATYDYQCDPQDSPLNAELGGINSGTKKDGCLWMAAVPPDSAPLSCQGTNLPQLVSLASDEVYYFGANNSRCYSVTSPSANGTTINCNHHTVLAVNGGTFVVLQSVGSATVENCYLKGFTEVVKGYNTSVTLLNSTILVNSTGLTPTTPVVNISNSNLVSVQLLNITTPYTGVYFNHVYNATLRNNIVNASVTAYGLYNSGWLTASLTSSSPKSGIGMVLSNSVIGTFYDSNLDGVQSGLVCSGSSQGALNFTDKGGIYCSSESKCGWLSQSVTTC